MRSFRAIEILVLTAFLTQLAPLPAAAAWWEWFLPNRATMESGKPVGATASARGSDAEEAAAKSPAADEIRLPYYELIPTLDTTEKKLQYLIYLRKFVPRLFEEAAQFDINLFDLLEKEGALLKKLIAENPEYRAALAQKTELVEITVETNGQREFVNVSIDSAAINEWRTQIRSTLDSLESVEGETLEQKIFTAVQAEQAKLRAPNFKGFAVALAKEMDGAQKAAVLRNENLAEASATVRAFIEENGLPNGFDPTKLSLPAGSSQEAVLERFAELTRTAIVFNQPNNPAKQRLGALITLHILSEENAEPDALVDSIASLDESKLRVLTDPDIFKPKAENFASVYQAGNRRMSKEVAGGLVGEFGKSFSDRKIEMKTVRTGFVRITEVTPDIGICRGLLGDDCSTQYSFPFPNDPDERVFVLTDEKGKSLGYISGTIVEANGKLQFYAITASGKRLTEQHTWMVLNALHLKCEELGFEGVVLPPIGRHAGLLNFEPVRGAYRAASSGPSIAIRYRNPAIRAALESYITPDGGQIANYDNMENNKAAVPFNPDLGAPEGLIIESKITPIAPPELGALSRKDIIEFMLDLQFGGREREIEDIAEIVNLDPKLVTGIRKILDNDSILPVKEWEAAINAKITELGLDADFLTRKSYLTEKGFLRASDSLNEEHIDRAKEILLRNARNHTFNELLQGTSKVGIGDVIADISPRVKDETALAKLATLVGELYPDSFRRLQRIQENIFSAKYAKVPPDIAEMVAASTADPATIEAETIRIYAERLAIEQKQLQQGNVIGYYLDIPDQLAAWAMSPNKETRDAAKNVIESMRHRSGLSLRSGKKIHIPYGDLGVNDSEHSERELLAEVLYRLESGRLDAHFGIDANDPLPGRAAALQSIFNRGGDERAVALLEELMGDYEYSVRARAIKLLGFRHANILTTESPLFMNLLSPHIHYESAIFFASMADGDSNPALFPSLIAELENLDARVKEVDALPDYIEGNSGKSFLNWEKGRIREDLEKSRRKLANLISRRHRAQLAAEILAPNSDWNLSRLHAFIKARQGTIYFSQLPGTPFFDAVWESRLPQALAIPDRAQRLANVELLANVLIDARESHQSALLSAARLNEIIRDLAPHDEATLKTLERIAKAAWRGVMTNRAYHPPAELGQALASDSRAEREAAAYLLHQYRHELIGDDPQTGSSSPNYSWFNQRKMLANAVELIHAKDYEGLFDEEKLLLGIPYPSQNGAPNFSQIFEDVLNSLSIDDIEFQKFLFDRIANAKAPYENRIFDLVMNAIQNIPRMQVAFRSHRGFWIESLTKWYKAELKRPKVNPAEADTPEARIESELRSSRRRSFTTLLNEMIKPEWKTPEREFRRFLIWADRNEVIDPWASNALSRYFNSNQIPISSRRTRVLTSVARGCASIMASFLKRAQPSANATN